MSPRSRGCLLVVLTFLLAPVVAGAQELRYKFQPGTTNAYVMEQKQNMKMSAMGQEIDMNINMTFDFAMTVDSVDTASGEAKVKYKFGKMKMTMEGGPFGNMEYDSSSDKEPEGPLAAAAPLFKALTQSEILMTVSLTGETKDVKYPEKLKAELENIAQNAGGPGGNMFSEDQLKQMMNNPVFSLPKEAVSPGKAWDNKTEMKLGPMGTMKIHNKYTYSGKEGAFEKIDQKMDIKMEASADAPFQMNMKTKEASGTILFDNAKGRIHEMKNKTVSEMELGPVGTMNMTQNMTLKLKQ
jgi:hypothetical protein